ncbi:MAG: hypothetical protein HYW02_01345 [Deltaproteobacteria bacterium]|nr:hypothetical protein [Deltaproteobacteria bacterium]
MDCKPIGRIGPDNVMNFVSGLGFSVVGVGALNQFRAERIVTKAVLIPVVAAAILDIFQVGLSRWRSEAHYCEPHPDQLRDLNLYSNLAGLALGGLFSSKRSPALTPQAFWSLLGIGFLIGGIGLSYHVLMGYIAEGRIHNGS